MSRPKSELPACRRFFLGRAGRALNYYEHHLGDYAQATAHLSFVEDAAYSRLIRKCYATERPLPADVQAVQRLAGARTREERAAVETVLAEFWELRDDGYHNQRCDTEILRYQDRQRKAKASADLRWGHTERNANAMRTHSDGNAPRACTSPQSPDTSKEIPPASRPPPAAAGRRPSKKCPPGFEVTSELREWCASEHPGVDWLAETAALRDYTFATGCTDWAGRWRNWMRKAGKQQRNGIGSMTFKERDAATLKAQSEMLMGSALPKVWGGDFVDMETRDDRLSLG